MAQWIAFDDASVLQLVRRTGNQAELGVGDPLQSALQSDGATLAILPAPGGNVLVLKIRGANHQLTKAPRYVATGFLGLVDEPADEEQSPVNRTWWQRLWA